jgi:formylglycine-generating enzyme required for sulfatase activity
MKRFSKLVAVVLTVAACNEPPTAPTVSISPSNPKSDADLKANIVTPATDPNGDAIVYTFAWLKDGAPQADLTTDTVPADRTAKGETWSVVVTPSDIRLNGPTARDEVTIGNSQPIATLAFEPADPVKGTPLKAVASATDADSDTVTFTYAWLRDSQATAFAGDTVPADQLARGQQWQVTVTPNDGTENGTPVTASVTVGNAKPVVASVTLTPETPTKATALSAAPAAPSDADGDVVTLKYAWAVNGTVVDGQTGPSLATSFFNKGQVVTVTVTPNDTKEDGAPVTASATIGNSAPTAPVATVTANPLDADDVTCSIAIGSADLDAADSVTYLFSWTKNGRPFSGATTEPSSSVVPNALTADGDVFACTVAATDGTATTAGNTATTKVVDLTSGALVTRTLAGVAFEFSYVSQGSYLRGSPDSDVEAFADEKPQHSVTLTKPFLILRNEVTQAQYLAVIGSNPSIFTGDTSRPVENVTWNEALEFCNRLSQLEGVSSGTYRLPTEAEWEYAARAGTTDPRYGALGEIGWYYGNSAGTTHPVRQKQPNAWTLFDMLGNVQEWTQDFLGEYTAGAQVDPTGPSTGSGRTRRGGNFNLLADRVRAAGVRDYAPTQTYKSNAVGLRPVRSAP